MMFHNLRIKMKRLGKRSTSHSHSMYSMGSHLLAGRIFFIKLSSSISIPCYFSISNKKQSQDKFSTMHKCEGRNVAGEMTWRCIVTIFLFSQVCNKICYVHYGHNSTLEYKKKLLRKNMS